MKFPMPDPYENIALASSPKPEFLKSSHTHLDFYVFKPVLTFFKKNLFKDFAESPHSPPRHSFNKKILSLYFKGVGFF